MKKKMLLVCGVLLVAMMIVVGCGGSNTLSGTYKLSGAEVNGQEFSGEQLKSLMALSGMSADMSFTFSGTDKLTVKASVSGQEMEQEGTYVLDGQKLSLTLDGGTQEAELKNGKIYVDSQGAVLILSK